MRPNYSMDKLQKKKIISFYRPQAKYPGKKRNETKLPWWKNKGFLISSWESFESFIKSDLFSEKKKSTDFSVEKTGKLKFRETDTQMCRFFESLYMTCLDAKKLQENVKGYTEFPMVPLISQLFSLVKYIFSKNIVKALYTLVAKRDFSYNSQWVLL